jgi:hypothetical protein
MICGALQTLNEEACEDVLDVPVAPVIVPTDSLPGEPSSLPLTVPVVIIQEPSMSDQSPDSVTECTTTNT